MTSWPRRADLPISHMPMQPSTQVTHIPEMDVTESSVLFFVRVAAEALTLESDIGSYLCLSGLVYLTGNARVHVTHHVVVAVSRDARRGQVGTTATDRLVWLGVGAT